MKLSRDHQISNPVSLVRPSNYEACLAVQSLPYVDDLELVWEVQT